MELHRYDYTIALSENEAYNTLVTTDLALNLGEIIFSNCAVIANTAAAMNCPQPLGVGRFGDETYSSSLDKILLIGGWASHGSARNIH